ncbi:MAG: glutathione S-transferase family protein [Methylococcales bacterium]
MISLYKFYPAFGLTDPSPFCVKVETFLRIVAAEYQTVCLSDPRKGPKGKLPFIRDGEQTIGDSTFILKYLIDTYRYPIDAHLSPEQHATGLALTRMLEEHLYWAIVYERWIDPSNWKKIRSQFFGGMPPVIRSVVPMIARNKVKSALHQQGLGRHSAEEIKTLADEDIRAVSDLLAGKDFILGDRPSSYDASVHAFISSIFYCTLDSPLKNTMLGFDNLRRYCERVRPAFHPEAGQT